MGRFNSKKTQKKKFNVTRKAPMRGGMMGELGRAMTPTLTTTCDFDIKYSKATANMLGWTKKNLMNKVTVSEFLKLENPRYVGFFKKNLETFCVNNQNKKYLKFCVNLLSCAGKPEKIYDVLYKMYIFEGEIKEVVNKKDKNKNTTEVNPSGKKYKLTSKLKELYKKRKQELQLEDADAAENFTTQQFVEEYERENITNMAKFFINVIKKSIISYEKTKIPVPGEKSEIVMKDKLEKFFTSIFGEKFEFEKITQDKLIELFTKHKKTIEQYSDSRLMKTISEELVDDDKDVKKSPFYMFVVFGAFITAIILESGFMKAPPGLEGGMS